MSASVRVQITDDQALLRGTFRLLIDREPGLEVVGEAVTGRWGQAEHVGERSDQLRPGWKGAARLAVAEPELRGAPLDRVSYAAAPRWRHLSTMTCRTLGESGDVIASGRRRQPDVHSAKRTSD